MSHITRSQKREDPIFELLDRMLFPEENLPLQIQYGQLSRGNPLFAVVDNPIDGWQGADHLLRISDIQIRGRGLLIRSSVYLVHQLSVQKTIDDLYSLVYQNLPGLYTGPCYVWRNDQVMHRFTQQDMVGWRGLCCQHIRHCACDFLIF